MTNGKENSAKTILAVLAGLLDYHWPDALAAELNTLGLSPNGFLDAFRDVARAAGIELPEEYTPEESARGDALNAPRKAMNIGKFDTVTPTEAIQAFVGYGSEGSDPEDSAEVAEDLEPCPGGDLVDFEEAMIARDSEHGDLLQVATIEWRGLAYVLHIDDFENEEADLEFFGSELERIGAGLREKARVEREAIEENSANIREMCLPFKGFPLVD